MSLLLLFPGISTPQADIPPPPPPVISASAGGSITFAPHKPVSRRRAIVMDVIRVPNYDEVIQLEDEEWVILLGKS